MEPFSYSLLTYANDTQEMEVDCQVSRCYGTLPKIGENSQGPRHGRTANTYRASASENTILKAFRSLVHKLLSNYTSGTT
jgi:hypothetical protein